MYTIQPLQIVGQLQKIIPCKFTMYSYLSNVCYGAQLFLEMILLFGFGKEMFSELRAILKSKSIKRWASTLLVGFDDTTILCMLPKMNVFTL